MTERYTFILLKLHKLNTKSNNAYIKNKALSQFSKVSAKNFSQIE